MTPAEITAAARKRAVLMYDLLRYGEHGRGRGADIYDQGYRKRVVSGLTCRTAKIGCHLVPQSQLTTNQTTYFQASFLGRWEPDVASAAQEVVS